MRPRMRMRMRPAQGAQPPEPQPRRGGLAWLTEPPLQGGRRAQLPQPEVLPKELES